MIPARLLPRSRTLAAGVLALMVGVLAGCMAQRMETSRALARHAQAFVVEPERARARLLVIGDSTAVGTGASTPAASVAGRLSARAPSLAIDNVARPGARFADLPGQLDAAPGKRYDAILVMAGGSDVLRLTGEATLRAAIDRVALRAKAMAPLVVVVPAGNLGSAPFFLPPLSWLVTARARVLHDVMRDEAALRGFAYVDLYRSRDDDAFAQDPGRFTAADGMHPSDAGYALWLDEILAQSPLATVLELGHVAGVPVLARWRANEASIE